MADDKKPPVKTGVADWEIEAAAQGLRARYTQFFSLTLEEAVSIVNRGVDLSPGQVRHRPSFVALAYNRWLGLKNADLSGGPVSGKTLLPERSRLARQTDPSAPAQPAPILNRPVPEASPGQSKPTSTQKDN